MQKMNSNIHTYLNTYKVTPDVVFLQDYWLTPSNLDRFAVDFPSHFCFGASAMCNAVEMGILRGRLFGGVMILLKHDLLHLTQTLCANERLVVIRLSNLLLCNVYFPCAGTADRELIIESLCDQIDDWIERFCECDCIIGGDFNMQLNDNSVQCSTLLSNFIAKNELHLCSALFNLLNKPTYVNDSLGCSSSIDHFFGQKYLRCCKL
jgi:exonuclease III